MEPTPPGHGADAPSERPDVRAKEESRGVDHRFSNVEETAGEWDVDGEDHGSHADQRREDRRGGELDRSHGLHFSL